MSNNRLISKFLHKTASTVEWMQNMGVGMYYGGRAQETESPDTPVMYPEIANYTARRGQLATILNHAIDRGAEVFYETRATKLIQEDGAVRGVEAAQDDGTKVIVRAKAVIVATGCYDGNEELAKKYLKYPARLCEPKWLAEGDGLLMCMEAGADTPGLGARVTHCNTADRAAMGRGADEKCVTVWQLPNLPAAVFLNYRGQRYTDENLAQNSLAIANANAAQGDWGDFLTFIDTGLVRRLAREGARALGITHVPGGGSRPYLDTVDFFADLEAELAMAEDLGLVVKGETLEELAKKLNMDPKVLTFEIDRYNAFARQGSDEDFFKDPATLHVMDQGPFYVVLSTCDSMGTCGGVRVDDELRVLDRDRNIIPGLYCAGACAGDIWGDSYGILEGATCAWAWNSGRMAGENAAAHLGLGGAAVKGGDGHAHT